MSRKAQRVAGWGIHHNSCHRGRIARTPKKMKRREFASSFGEKLEEVVGRGVDGDDEMGVYRAAGDFEEVRDEIRGYAKAQQAKKNAKDIASYDKREGAVKATPRWRNAAWREDVQASRLLSEPTFLPRCHGPCRVGKSGNRGGRR